VKEWSFLINDAPEDRPLLTKGHEGHDPVRGHHDVSHKENRSEISCSGSGVVPGQALCARRYGTGRVGPRMSRRPVGAEVGSKTPSATWESPSCAQLAASRSRNRASPSGHPPSESTACCTCSQPSP
jgi:hypothetical protein